MAEREHVRKVVQKLLRTGKIRPSNSPWGAPILLVPKKNEMISGNNAIIDKRMDEPDDNLRMCCDFRNLNGSTVKDRYALPLIDELIDETAGSRVYSLLDLRSGYHQVAIAAKDVEKTAFRTHDGLFEHLVMPFGLTNAPATYQRLLNRVLADVIGKYASCYIDDILIFSKNAKEHALHVHHVLSLLKDANLFVKLSKCAFFQDEVTFVGHTLHKGCIKPDARKVKMIMDWPVPKSVKELRSFLGMVNFCRRFIPQFSTRSRHLTDLIKTEKKRRINKAKWIKSKGPTNKSVPWVWTVEHDKEFKFLREALCEYPVLRLPDQSKTFTVTTDASHYALGAVLLQTFDDGIHPVGYFSKKLNGAALNYTTHDKEMLAIIKAIEFWRHYLFGAHFKVLSDHVTLKYFLTQSKLNLRQVRWQEFLQYFDVEINYKPGAQQQFPDALSRPPTIAAISRSLSLDSFHFDWLPWIEKDEAFGPILQALKDGTQRLHRLTPNYLKFFCVRDRKLFYNADGNERLCVPLEGGWRRKLIFEMHKSNLAAHVGVNKTLGNLSEKFFWPKMVKDVKQFVRVCEQCQRAKIDTRGKLGLHQPLDIPTLPWESVAMDFVTGLPISTNGADAILVVVDRFSKRGRFLPCRKDFSARQVADIFFSGVVCLFGLPKSIVSDRDPKFTSLFWSQLFLKCGTKLRFSSAFHPQTDGLTERLNRTLEELLRCQCVLSQENWVDHLAFVEFGYNNAKQASTKFTPFFVDTGRNPICPVDPSPSSKANHLEEFLADQKIIHRMTRDNLVVAIANQEKIVNTKRRVPDFMINDLVFLDSKNLRYDRIGAGKAKLFPRRVGPFRIIGKISETAFRLDLPATWRIHNVFHSSLLARYFADDVGATTSGIPDLNLLPIAEAQPVPWRILKTRVDNLGNSEFLVQYSNTAEDDAIWEPNLIVQTNPDLLNNFFGRDGV
jgi:hypothetical protein